MSGFMRYDNGTRIKTKLSKTELFNNSGLTTSYSCLEVYHRMKCLVMAWYLCKLYTRLVSWISLCMDYLMTTDKGFSVPDSFVPDIINELDQYFSRSYP